MAHDKVYGFCESKCKVEVPSKEEFDELKEKTDSFTGEVYNNSNVEIGVWELEEDKHPIYRRCFPKTKLRHYYEYGQGGARTTDIKYIAQETLDSESDWSNNGSGSLQNFIDNNTPSSLTMKDRTIPLTVKYVYDDNQVVSDDADVTTFTVKNLSSKWWTFNCADNIKYIIIEYVDTMYVVD